MVEKHSHPGQFFTYDTAPNDWRAPSGSPEWDYYYFTKYNGRTDQVSKVEFDQASKTFTVFLTKKEYDARTRNGRLPDTYDNYVGTKYAVRYKLVKIFGV